LATQTESIYTRNKEVWKTTNRDILEKHLVDDGLPFSKESVDAAHALYVKELQDIDEKKAQEEKAKADAERKKGAANPPPSPPTNTPVAPQYRLMRRPNAC
jgi:hypothetical protein